MVTAVDDNFYKIMSEALLVLTLIVKTIRPLGEGERVEREGGKGVRIKKCLIL